MKNLLVTANGRIRILEVVLLAVAIVALTIWSLRQPPPAEPLPDFKQYRDISAMKAAFFSYLRPLVERQNAMVAAQRQQLEVLQASYTAAQQLSSRQRQQLDELAAQYQLEIAELSLEQQLATLLLRVDTIPLELALVQAAKESGWGRSRFALTGNNLFGQWCYDTGCGVVPKNRNPGKTHELKYFATVEAAIADYLLNLNTHPRYRPMRLIRAKLRKQQGELNGLALAEGLLHYSERRQAYVSELKSMIRHYRKFAKRVQEAQVPGT